MGVRILATILGALLGAPAQSRQDSAPLKIEDLAFISGGWQEVSNNLRIDEHWTSVAGGSLMGVSRTVKDGRTVAFEYLRIESRSDGIYYVAHPRGQSPGTEFKLVRLQAREAVFENPLHDFPKRIIYRRNPDGSLTARVEGDGSEREKPQEFHYKPIRE